MSKNIKEIEPRNVWTNFANLNAVPRASKKEERVIKFITDFGKGLGLETIVDKSGNVVVKKPATEGMENRKTVILQSHLDMVHQKNSDTEFDFDTEGIKMFIEGDWVKAEGTTLGADNGLGVSTIMAILESSDIPHPAIEALFTVDEETGMTGAKGLDTEMLEGKILLNLDTEEDDEIGVGCAGGVDVTAIREYKVEEVPTNTVAYTIKIKGLSGGHSGMDINKGLGNANKIMARLLLDSFVNFGLRISEIDGGGLRNAIPRESRAWVVVDKITEDAFCMEMAQLAQTIQTEYRTTDPKLKIEISSIESVSGVMEIGVQEGLIKALCAAHNGVYRMSPEIEDLVETSNNIARVKVNNGLISVDCLTRSSVESTKLDLANNLRATFELIGCTVEFNSDYPGWEPNMDSEILGILKETYIEMFDDEPHIAACHAGLECGLIGQHYPELDMISFGPTILGAHSPDERVSISSVKKFWNFLQEILKRIPKK